MKRVITGAAVLAAFAAVWGAGTAGADVPWPDPFNPGVKNATEKVVVFDVPWPDPFNPPVKNAADKVVVFDVPWPDPF